MKTRLRISLSSKPYSHLLPVLLLSLSTLTLSACQKTPEPETGAETQSETEVQSAPVSTTIDDDTATVKVTPIEGEIADTMATDSEREASLAELENNIGAAGVTQITDVQYRSATGATLSVIFETSATGVLNAMVTLPNKPKMTLSAPEGQGNNPTYRSKEGDTELVSHGGGSSIDLMQNGSITSFEATSAEAEVVTEP
jgi:hypothetical protein